jgi:hypothetical protein
VVEGPLLQNQALAVAHGGGPSTSRSSNPGERMCDGALGLLNGGAELRFGVAVS